MSNKSQNKKKQTLDCDWSHFQEHLKVNIPWIVCEKLENNKYLIPSKTFNRYVSNDDIQKWKMKNTSISLKIKMICESAEYIPIQYEKHGGIKIDENPNNTRDNPLAFQEIMKRESNQAKEKSNMIKNKIRMLNKAN
ncbi:hypothetical protein ABPG73_007201 [Tetrahymena malaccensis]